MANKPGEDDGSMSSKISLNYNRFEEVLFSLLPHCDGDPYQSNSIPVKVTQINTPGEFYFQFGHATAEVEREQLRRDMA